MMWLMFIAFFIQQLLSALSTSSLRREYGPGCLPAKDRVVLTLYGGGQIMVAKIAADAFRALNACMIKFSYETEAYHTGAYNCRKITGGDGLSLHSFGIAADYNWNDNPYGPRLVTNMPQGMINLILAIRTNSGAQVFRWGGYYSKNKDAMHFEVVCSRADLLTGIDPRSVPGAVVTWPGMPADLPPHRQEIKGTWRNGDSGPGPWLLQGMVNVMIAAGYIKHPKLVVDGEYGPTTAGAMRHVERFGRGMQAYAKQPLTITVNGVAGKAELGCVKFWNDVASKRK